jgi:hypothetical protein
VPPGKRAQCPRDLAPHRGPPGATCGALTNAKSARGAQPRPVLHLRCARGGGRATPSRTKTGFLGGVRVCQPELVTRSPCLSHPLPCAPALSWLRQRPPRAPHCDYPRGSQPPLPSPGRWPENSRNRIPIIQIGADSVFFALLGSAPQELNTVRPEAKLTR